MLSSTKTNSCRSPCIVFLLYINKKIRNIWQFKKVNLQAVVRKTDGKKGLASKVQIPPGIARRETFGGWRRGLLPRLFLYYLRVRLG